MDERTLLIVAAVLAALWLIGQFRLHRRLDGFREQASSTESLRREVEALREQVRSSLAGGQDAIDRRLHETNRMVGDVRRELGEVDRQTRHVAEAARDLRGLQDLLRSPKLRGGIGEYLLAELLAQVLPQDSFALQHRFPGGDRVDAVIRAGERLVPVEAKFPLENYRRLAAAGDDAERTRARRALTADVKAHVDAIAGRYVLPGEGTFDFALMYLPAEAIYREAFLAESSSEDLLHYAIARKVIPTSPQSFYAYLQVIVLGLHGLAVERDAREIVERLAAVRGRLARPPARAAPARSPGGRRRTTGVRSG